MVKALRWSACREQGRVLDVTTVGDMTQSLAWNEWCLLNVMLIKRLNASLAERLTIGRVHERCADGGKDEVIRLVRT